MVPFTKEVTMPNSTVLQTFLDDDDVKNNFESKDDTCTIYSSQKEINSPLDCGESSTSHERLLTNCEDRADNIHPSHTFCVNTKNEDLQRELATKTKQIQTLQEQLESMSQLYSNKNLLQLEQMNRLVAVIMEEKNQSSARFEIKIREQSDRINVLSKKLEAKDLVIQKLKEENKILKTRNDIKIDSFCDSNNENSFVSNSPKQVGNRSEKNKPKEDNKGLRIKYISKDDTSCNSSGTIHSKSKYVRMLTPKKNPCGNDENKNNNCQHKKLDDSSCDSNKLTASKSKYVGSKSSNNVNRKQNIMKGQGYYRHAGRPASIEYVQNANVKYWYPTNTMPYYSGSYAPTI